MLKPKRRPDRPALAAKIKALREDTPIPMSQEPLAAFIDVSISAVSRWEKGDLIPLQSKLDMIADFYGVDPNWLNDDSLTMDDIVRSGVPGWARGTKWEQTFNFPVSADVENRKVAELPTPALPGPPPVFGSPGPGPEPSLARDVIETLIAVLGEDEVLRRLARPHTQHVPRTGRSS